MPYTQTNLLSIPIIGEKYIILCLKYKDDNDNPWIPLRGEIHADESEFFSTDKPHYHVDWRFAGNAIFKYFEMKLNFDDWNDAPLTAVHADLPSELFELKFMKKLCVREDLPFPTSSRARAWNVPYGNYKKILFREELYKIYKGKSLNNNQCPHRGYKMIDVAPDCKGHKTCPLHGLTFGKSNTVIR